MYDCIDTNVITDSDSLIDSCVVEERQRGTMVIITGYYNSGRELWVLTAETSFRAQGENSE